MEIEYEVCQPKSNVYNSNQHHFEKELRKLRRVAMSEYVDQRVQNQRNFKKCSMARAIWTNQGCNCPKCIHRTESGKLYKQQFEYGGKQLFFFVKKIPLK